jgi:hypothetical protein
MPEHHKVKVVRIDEILPHSNADTLGIVHVDGYQVVVKKDNYKVGDLAIYIPPDTIVPEHPAFAFLWENTEPTEKRRRITVRRFRKEWSEGLLIPVSEFIGAAGFTSWEAGDNVAELLGFKHYEESDPTYVLGKQGRTLSIWQRILKFFGFGPKPFGPKDGPGVYGMESIKNYPRVFQEGEPVFATEKIHGSNARFYFDGKQFWVGSHKKWWKDKANIWWRIAQKYPWIEEFCRANPNFTLRGEVTPTQPGYQYGATPEEQFFAFDVQYPDGSYINKQALYADPVFVLNGAPIHQLVPVVYAGPYDAAKINALAEGKTLVHGAKHIREGIVVSRALEGEVVRGVGRAQLKLKSMAFLEKETK